MSVPRAVAAFLVAGLVVLAAVATVLLYAEHRSATAEAIRQARTLTTVEARDVVGQVLDDAALKPGPAQEALDRVIRQRVLSPQVVRVKIWDPTGRIIYSDDTKLIGRTFVLAREEAYALDTGRTSAEVTNLSAAENIDEKHYGRLLQVYLGVRTPQGTKVLFETYQPYSVITEASRRLWMSTLPVIVGGLVVLYLIQVPLAYRMASRLRASQEERERLLVQSLATSDRERAVIAADLHDGVAQGLAGTSYILSAGAEKARTSDREAAETMARAATDLRRWVRELRSLIVTITPPTLHAQGLGVSLADLVATLEVRGVDVKLDVTGTDNLDETTEALLYRGAQEAVRNIVRHAEARNVELMVSRTTSSNGHGEQMVLIVRDDGKGIDPAAPARARGRGSVGLGLLDALTRSQGGELAIHGEPGTGTTFTLKLRP